MAIGLRDFIGVWTLAREIEDVRLGVRGRFDGRCVIAWDGDDVVQTETGTLRFGDAAPMQAQRVYRWRAAGAVISVSFEDGRAFHSFGPGHAETAQHLCGSDLYEVQYGFADWPVWTSTWRVMGPRKDLVLRNRFARSEGSPS